MSKRLIKILAISLICVMVPAAVVVSVVCVAAAQTYELAIKTLGFIDGLGEITYRVNGEEYTEKMSVKKDSVVTITADATGYDFKAWKTEEGETLHNEVKYSFTISENTTLSAEFEIIKYNITYVLGEESRISTTLDWGTKLSDDQNKKDEGKELTGWKAGSDTKVYTKAEFRDRTVELTPNYEDIKYMVSYNGATAVEVAWGTELVAGDDKVDEGKLFAGWKYNNDIVTVAEFGIVKDVINLTSTYSDIVYNVSYDGADVVSVDWGDTLKTDVTVGEDKKLVGWKKAGDATVYTTAKFGYPTETISLTHEEEEADKVYQITFKYQKNGNAEALVASTTYGKVLNTILANPNDHDYGKIFLGWKEGESTVTTATFDSEKVTLNAEYATQKYDITYKYKAKYDAAETSETVSNVEFGSALKSINADGMIFKGWKLSETKYDSAKFGVNTDASNKAIELTADQSIITFNVIYKYGETTDTAVSVEYGATLPTNKGLVDGDIYKGWKYNETSYTTATFDEALATSTITLTLNKVESYKNVNANINYQFKIDSKKYEAEYIIENVYPYNKGAVSDEPIEEKYFTINMTNTVDNPTDYTTMKAFAEDGVFGMFLKIQVQEQGKSAENYELKTIHIKCNNWVNTYSFSNIKDKTWDEFIKMIAEDSLYTVTDRSISFEITCLEYNKITVTE